MAVSERDRARMRIIAEAERSWYLEDLARGAKGDPGRKIEWALAVGGRLHMTSRNAEKRRDKPAMTELWARRPQAQR